MVLGRRDNRGGEEGNMCWGCGREGYVDVDICSGGSKELYHSQPFAIVSCTLFSSACGPKSSSSSSPLLLCSALSVVATFQQQLMLPSVFLVNQLLIILVIVTSSVHR